MVLGILRVLMEGDVEVIKELTAAIIKVLRVHGMDVWRTRIGRKERFVGLQNRG